jgi:thiol-disulfide isomerase/thioredoxin
MKAFFIMLCFLIIYIITEESKESVLQITDINILKSLLNEKQKAFIDIYLPTCPHCSDFAPIYNNLAQTVNFNLT